jgi:hypothetical protein
MNQIGYPVLGYEFVMMGLQLKVEFCIVRRLAPVFQFFSYPLIILPIHGWAPWSTETMVIDMMYEGHLQGILQVLIRASSVLQNCIAHVVLETFGIGGGALGGSFLSSAESKYRTRVDLHLVVWVCKENNFLVKDVQQSVILFL